MSAVTITLAAHEPAPHVYSRACPLCDRAVTVDRGREWQVLERCPHFEGIDGMFQQISFRFSEVQSCSTSE